MNTEYSEYFCPLCNSDTEHEIIKEENGLIVKCRKCGVIHNVNRKPDNDKVDVKTVISNGNGQSTETYVNFDKHLTISVGKMYVYVEDEDMKCYEVTSIDTGYQGNREVNSAKASEIRTLWGRSLDRIPIKISLHDGGEIKPIYTLCVSQDIFGIGGVYRNNQLRYMVTRIILKDGTVLSEKGGMAYADKIKEVYAINPD